MSDIANSALFAAAVSAAISLVIAWIQLRQGLDSQRAQSQLDISAKYDRMVDYPLPHPEVLSLARHWQRECWDAIYDQRTDEGRGYLRVSAPRGPPPPMIRAIRGMGRPSHGD